MNGGSGISFKELFNKDIDRNINGVIKANDEKNLGLSLFGVGGSVRW